MKFSTVVFLLFPASILATPIAAPNPSPNAVVVDETANGIAARDPESSPNPATEATAALEARADKWCTLHPNISGPQGCDTDRWSSVRRRTVQLNERFGVRCWSVGQSVNGNTKWDYIPGWNCWISARWTNSGCETGVPSPC